MLQLLPLWHRDSLTGRLTWCLVFCLCQILNVRNITYVYCIHVLHQNSESYCATDNSLEFDPPIYTSDLTYECESISTFCIDIQSVWDVFQVAKIQHLDTFTASATCTLASQIFFRREFDILSPIGLVGWLVGWWIILKFVVILSWVGNSFILWPYGYEIQIWASYE